MLPVVVATTVAVAATRISIVKVTLLLVLVVTVQVLVDDKASQLPDVPVEKVPVVAVTRIS